MTNKTITGIVTWLKGWFYDKDEITSKEQALQSQINNRALTSDLSTTNTNLSNLASTVSGKANSSHSHYTNDEVLVQQGTTYANIGLSAGNDLTLSAFLEAIDTKLGQLGTSIAQLSSFELIKVVTGSSVDNALGTASSATMDKLYVYANGSTSGKNRYGIYVTVKNGSNYTWEKIDDADLQGFLTSSDIVDNLTSTATNKALSAKQGKALNTAISGKADTNHSHVINSNADNLIKVASGESYNNVITLAQDTSLGIVLQSFGNAIGTAKTNAQVKTIDLIPKTTNATGAIKITYNDE